MSGTTSSPKSILRLMLNPWGLSSGSGKTTYRFQVWITPDYCLVKISKNGKNIPQFLRAEAHVLSAMNSFATPDTYCYTRSQFTVMVPLIAPLPPTKRVSTSLRSSSEDSVHPLSNTSVGNSCWKIRKKKPGSLDEPARGPDSNFRAIYVS